MQIDVRPADNPLIDCVWRARSTGVGALTSVASSHWHLVVSDVDGAVEVTVHGPETRPVTMPLPPEGRSWVGVRFRLGVVLQDLPIPGLVDRELLLPERATDPSGGRAAPGRVRRTTTPRAWWRDWRGKT